MIEYAIERAKPCDTALIYSSWLDGFRRAPLVARMSSREYYECMHPAITEMLSRSQVLVARPPDWPEGVLAWAVGEQLCGDFILHAVYVKALYRRCGIARALVDELGPSGERMYSAGRPPYTRILDSRGFRHEPRAFPARISKEKTA